MPNLCVEVTNKKYYNSVVQKRLDRTDGIERFNLRLHEKMWKFC